MVRPGTLFPNSRGNKAAANLRLETQKLSHGLASSYVPDRLPDLIQIVAAWNHKSVKITN